VKLIGADRARDQLIEQAALRSGHTVLDIGCGTGSFVLRLLQQAPGVEVHGVDPDPNALERARRKAALAGRVVVFAHGFGGALPYPAATFDRVFSSYVLHHLPADEKTRTLAEARRVMKPGGALHLLDFAGPDAAPRNFLERRLHAGRLLAGNTEARVLRLLRDAGFGGVARTGTQRLRIGQVAYYSGVAA
jgi:ubiquinone/menaquinone biosynthesis C-methylase UbiE